MAVVKRGRGETIHTRIDDVHRSAAVVQAATGVTPNLDDPALVQRLQSARMMRTRQKAREQRKWNTAMRGMTEQIEASMDEQEAMELRFDLAKLCSSAAQLEQALQLLEAVERAVGAHPAVVCEKATLLGRLGREADLRTLLEQAAGSRFASIAPQIRSAAKAAASGAEEPRRDQGAAWGHGGAGGAGIRGNPPEAAGRGGGPCASKGRALV